MADRAKFRKTNIYGPAVSHHVSRKIWSDGDDFLGDVKIFLPLANVEAYNTAESIFSQ